MNAPHSEYVINELIEAGKYDTAIQYAADNEEFYNKKADEMRDLYVKAKTKEIMYPIDEAIDEIAQQGLGLSIRK